MKRVILDTNIYGLLAKDAERLKIVGRLKVESGLVVYGFKLIRNELRKVPKTIKIEQRSFRIDLLNLYDSIIEEHILEFNNNLVKIAENYYKAYKELGGSKSKDELINDFMIVSVASLNNLDIVISNDEKSMKAEKAIRAYKLINSVISKRTPQLISYEELKKLLRGGPNELF